MDRAARDVRCHGRDVWPSRLRDVGRQLSISWRRGEFDPKLRFAQSPSHDWPPARPTAHPTWCRSYSRSALGARPRRPVQTLSTPPSTRSGKRRSGCAGSPISSTIHGPACSSTAMPMIGPSCGGSGPTGRRDSSRWRGDARRIPPAARQICSIPIGSVERPGNRNSSPALGQLARLTTTTAPIAYYSPDPTLVLGGSWEKSCLLRPAGPHHGNRPRRTGGKPWPTE